MLWSSAAPGALIAKDPAAAAGSYFSLTSSGANLNDDVVHEACFPGVIYFDMAEADAGEHTVSASIEGGACTVYGGDDPPLFAHHISYVAYTCE